MYRDGERVRWRWWNGDHPLNYRKGTVTVRGGIGYPYLVTFDDGSTMLCFERELLPASNEALS